MEEEIRRERKKIMSQASKLVQEIIGKEPKFRLLLPEDPVLVIWHY